MSRRQSKSGKGLFGGLFSRKKEEKAPPRPPKAELTPMFASLLEELALPKAKREQMMKMPDDKKWTMLLQHKATESLGAHVKGKKGEKVGDTPEYYIGELSKTPWKLDTIRNLRVSLGSQPISWLSHFITLSGLDVLVGGLREMHSSGRNRSTDQTMHSELVRCLKALMNNNVGLKAVMSYPHGITQLAMSLSTENLRTRAMVLELLAAVSLVPPDGHKITVEAMSEYQEQKKEKKRFQHLVESLKDPKATVEFKVTALSFINALVNFPETLDMRVRIRGEFLRLGIVEIMKKMHEEGLEELNTQLDVFNEEMEEDNLELAEQFGQLEVNLNDPDSMFSALHKQAEASEFQESFTEVLQHFISLSSDAAIGPIIWTLFAKLAHQVEAHKDYVGSVHEDDKLNLDSIMSGLGADIGQVQRALVSHAPAPPVKEAAPEPASPGSPSGPPRTAKHQTTLKQNYEKRIAELEKRFAAVNTELEAAKKQAEEKERGFQEEVRGLQAQVTEYKSSATGEDNAALLKQVNELKGKIELLKKSGGKLPEGQDDTDDLRTEASDDEDAATPAGGLKIAVPKDAPTGDKKADDAKKEEAKPASPVAAAAPAAAAPAAAAPPPPPLPGASAAPPPPPLPGPGGAGAPPPPPLPGPGGMPPPPPMPGMGGMRPALGKPAKPVVKPKHKMKGLQWAKIPNIKIAKTFWDTADEDHYKEVLDPEELESLFAAKDFHKVASPTGSIRHAPAAAHKNVTLIDAKRANNLAIMVSQFKIPFSGIRDAVLAMDETTLTSENVKALSDKCPTKDEIEQVQHYTEDPRTLGTAEKYIMTIMVIPMLDKRLETMVFKRRFWARLHEIKPEIKGVAEACSELKSSKRFSGLLELVLKIGNYLNGSTFRGAAWGFKLETLSRLNDTKSTDNSMTLLRYIVGLCGKKEDLKPLLEFMDEMPSVEQAQRVSVEDVTKDVKELNRGIKDIEKMIEAYKPKPKPKAIAAAPGGAGDASASGATSPSSTGSAGSPLSSPRGGDHHEPVVNANPNDKYAEVMQKFVEEAKGQVDKITVMLKDMREQFKATVTFYGEDSEKAKPEEFFSQITVFNQLVERAVKQNEREAREAERRAKAAQLQATLRNMGNRRATHAAAGAGGADNSAGVMDDLIASLHTGDAFRVRRLNRPSTELTSPRTTTSVRRNSTRRTGSTGRPKPPPSRQPTNAGVASGK